MKLLLSELPVWQYWITIAALLLLLTLIVFIITRKFLIPAIFIRAFSGVVIKKKRGELRPVLWSKDLDSIFKGIHRFGDVSLNLTDKEILEGGPDKRFCVLKGNEGYYLAHITITTFQFFGFRYLITLPDISQLITKLAYTLNPIVLTDHEGEVIYADTNYGRGFFFPSDLLGDHPKQGKWDYLDIVNGDWSRFAFVTRDLKRYWVTKPVKIDDAALVIWQGYKIQDLQKEIDFLPFPAKIELFGYPMQNKVIKELDAGNIDKEMPLKGEVSWHSMNVSLPLSYGFTTYEDRLSTQARQLETMLGKALEQRSPDPESFVNYHLPMIIDVLHPLYLKVTKDNREVKKVGEYRALDTDVTPMGRAKSLYEYNFEDQSGEVHVHFQIDYPLTNPIKRFLEFCLFELLPLQYIAGGKKEAEIGMKISAGLRQIQEKMDAMQKGATLFHERLYSNLIELDRKRPREGYSGDLIDLLKDTAYIKDLDIVFREPDVSFDEDVDVLKNIKDIAYIESEQLAKKKVFPYLQREYNLKFMVKTNKSLMEKALEIILLEMFPLGKQNDLMSVTVSDNEVKIFSGKDENLAKKFPNMELEMKFAERVMEKSGLTFLIKGSEIILAKKNTIS